MQTNAVLKGSTEAIASLNGLAKAPRNKILRGALRKSGNVLAKAVKAQTNAMGRDRYTSKENEAAANLVRGATAALISQMTRKKDIRAAKKQEAITLAGLVIQHQMAKAIGVVIKQVNGLPVAKVGARRGLRVMVGTRTRGKNKGQPFYYSPSRVLHLKEKGHGGPHPAGPHPFLFPGFEAARDEAAQVLAEEIKKGLAEEAAKSAAKAWQ